MRSARKPPMAPTRWRLLLSAMLIVSVRGFHAPASARRRLPTRRAASPAACDTPAPSNLRTALLISGAGSTAAWTATASFALCTYKPHRWTHNLIGVSQALTALPLLWACLAVLHAAAKPDGDGLSLRSPECRRLSLGLAAASLWSAIAVVGSRAFTAAVVRTSDPVVYPMALSLAATAAHMLTATVCIFAWRCAGGSLASVLPRLLRSLWRLGPNVDVTTSISDSDARHIELATASTAFAAFASLAVFAPFPLATVPSLLGKRLARAYGAWALLAATALHSLKEGGDTPGGPTLRRALRVMSVMHLALVLIIRPILEGPAVYPAAMACLPAVIASLLAFALTVHATRRGTIK